MYSVAQLTNDEEDETDWQLPTWPVLGPTGPCRDESAKQTVQSILVSQTK